MSPIICELVERSERAGREYGKGLVASGSEWLGGCLPVWLVVSAYDALGVSLRRDLPEGLEECMCDAFDRGVRSALAGS